MLKSSALLFLFPSAGLFFISLLTMTKRWIVKESPDEDLVDRINSSLGFGYLASKILLMRGIDNYDKARAFFKPKLSDIHDPFLMQDMDKAVARIVNAIEGKEKILIYGDYDVDGTTSVSLMYLYLQKIYDSALLDFYIPDRNLEGYGISTQGIDYAKAEGFSLIIALDCGIKSVDKVAYANALGVDFIICDHHLPGKELPAAVAVLDPKRADCAYPYQGLSGCGVGFKLCQGLNSVYKIPDKELHQLSDLLAISIAADIVPITGENRALAKMGLKKLRTTKRPGLKTLISPEKLRHFTISNIVFNIAPKINAAGRISHAKTAVELLITDDSLKARQIAERIESLNDTRRDWDSSMTEAAIKQVHESHQENTFSTVVYDPEWNKGVIGIVASRLIEEFYKPTLVFTDGSNGELVASARSVADFDLHHALDQCSDLFLKFGGHRAAAGLSMEKQYFAEFKKRFEEVVKATIKEHQKTPSIEIDSIVNLNDFNRGFLRFHHRLAPFGPENMKPIFVIKNACAHGSVRRIGKMGSHLKFDVTQEGATSIFNCLAFKSGAYFKEFSSKKFDLVFTLEENYWQGDVTHFLNVKDFNFHS